LLGLKQGQAKMSKSDPDSAIFMEDTYEDIQRKIRKAYCPPKEVRIYLFVGSTLSYIFLYCYYFVVLFQFVFSFLVLLYNESLPESDSGSFQCCVPLAS